MVVIPARDEEALIAACLRSVLAAAVGVDVPVSVVVAADGCLDTTVSVARGFSGIRVLEVESSNVGAARAAGVRAALRRVSRAVRSRNMWIANTDADSTVPPNWLSHQLALMRSGVDVMIGTVRPPAAELSEEQWSWWRATHVAGEPNGHVHGANLGFRASTYRAAGGYRSVPEHEDVDLVARMMDARTVATASVAAASVATASVATDECEVETSARRVGRTPGGYAGYLRAHLPMPMPMPMPMVDPDPDAMSATGRVDGFVDLRSYAAIGDGRTVALIAQDGSVDWLPIPKLDSAPVFARLLDADGGGCIQLAPAAPFTATRRYIPGTNVLETTFTTAHGVARLTDALVTGFAGRLPWVELARRVDGISGKVAFTWAVVPGSLLGRASPWVDATLHGPVLRVGGVSIVVGGLRHGFADAMASPASQSLHGSFTVTPGSRSLLVVAGTALEPLHIPRPELSDEGIDRTIENGKRWSADFHQNGRWADAVQRSALALKLLIYAPSGAIAAAATTSLPESSAGNKNWDYRFAWVRDASYTVHALTSFGLREETHAAVAWLIRTIRRDGSGARPSIFYTLDGGDPAEPTELFVEGWRGIGPVVEGNPAAGQRQHGIYGDLLAVMREYVAAGNVLDVDTGRMLAAVADVACDEWHQPDSGMWELPEERRYTSSAMGCWQALDAAIELADLGQIPGDGVRWRAEQERIAGWVAENCWSASLGSYLAWPGSNQPESSLVLDASVLLHAASGFDRGPRMSSTIDAIRDELGTGALIHRYSGMRREEGAFVACSFWCAAALAWVGRQDEAVALMDEMVGLANDVGLYSEMIDPADGSFLGNLPQGLSHLALITAAMAIGRAASVP